MSKDRTISRELTINLPARATRIADDDESRIRGNSIKNSRVSVHLVSRLIDQHLHLSRIRLRELVSFAIIATHVAAS